MNTEKHFSIKGFRPFLQKKEENSKFLNKNINTHDLLVKINVSIALKDTFQLVDKVPN